MSSSFPETASIGFPGLTSDEALRLLKIHGLNQLPNTVKNRHPANHFLRQLIFHPSSVISLIAIIIEGFLEHWAIFGILIFIWIVHASLFRVYTQTDYPLDDLKMLLDDGKSNAKRDGCYISINTSFIVPNDIVILTSSSVVPADCRILSGEIEVNQQAITGEIFHESFGKDDICLMGCVICQGKAEAIVESTGINTVIGKAYTQFQQTNKSYHNDKGGISEAFYTMIISFIVIALFLCVTHFVYVFFIIHDTKRAVAITAVLIVASVPFTMRLVAYSMLSISFNTYNDHGVMTVKNFHAIDYLARVSTLCVDMKGFFTLNQAILQENNPSYLDGQSDRRVLMYAALTCKPSPHSTIIEHEILDKVDPRLLETFEVLNYHSSNPLMKCSECSVRDKTTGVKWIVRKGDPNIIISLLDPIVQQNSIDVLQKDVDRLEESGLTVIAVARSIANSNDTWEVIGLLSFLDPPNLNAIEAIRAARSIGLQVKMLSHEHSFIMKNVTRSLHCGNSIISSTDLSPRLTTDSAIRIEDRFFNTKDIHAADGFSNITPQHKHYIIDVLCETSFVVGVTGVCVHDAQSLKRSHLRIAPRRASDHIKSQADIILNESSFIDLINNIIMARKDFSRIIKFFHFRFSTSCHILLFLFIATFAFEPSNYTQPPDMEISGGPWPQFFQMPVLLILIVYLWNDCILSATLRYHHQRSIAIPCRWNTHDVARTFLWGFIPLGSTLLLLQILLNSWKPDSLWKELGLTSLQYGEIVSAIFLKLSLSQSFCLISTMADGDWFWNSWPGTVFLLIAGIAVTVGSSVLSLFYPTTKPEDIEVLGLINNLDAFGFVWIVSLIVFLFQDAIKVVLSIETVCRRVPSTTLLASSPVERLQTNTENCDVTNLVRVQGANEQAVHVPNNTPVSFIGKIECVYQAPIKDKDPLVDILSGRHLLEQYKDGSMNAPIQFPRLYLEACTDTFKSRCITARKGGFGCVYEACDNETKFSFLVQHWIISKITLDDLKYMPTVHRHPNIVPLIGFSLGEREIEECYVLYNSKARESLCQLINKEQGRKKLNSKQRLEVLYDVCLALYHLHKMKDSFHSDIKSDNIILDSDGNSKLLGCGLAYILNDSSQLLGTQGYICPWYSQGGKRFRQECDIYSFGVVMTELITGKTYPSLQVDEYIIAKDGVSILMDDADRDAGVGWVNVLEDLCSLSLSCIDPNPIRRPTADTLRKSLSLLLGKIDSS